MTAVRRRALLAALPLGLAACGFELRRAPALPFARIALAGFTPRSPLGDELRRLLAQSAQVVDAPAQAEVVLHALADRREKSVVASTAAGQVREVQLRVVLEFRLASAAGRELIAPTAMRLSRDMNYSETLALGKEQEEEQLYTAMQSDIALQVMRRLARVSKA